MFHNDCDDHADTQLSYTAHRHLRDTDGGCQSNKRRRWNVRDADEADGGGDSSGRSGDASGSGDGKDSSSAKSSASNPCLADSDVASRCFVRGNHIYFFSGVSKDSVYRLKEAICKLNEKHREARLKYPTVDIVPKPIYLHINSYGGGVFAAFAAIDFIQQSEIPVHTIIEGASASAATLMSVVGAKRYIRPHASMLIHQLSSWFGGKLTEIEDDYKNITQMHNTIKDIYKKHTNIRDTELEEMLKHDLWWTADKCLQEGLVDEVWTGSE